MRAQRQFRSACGFLNSLTRDLLSWLLTNHKARTTPIPSHSRSGHRTSAAPRARARSSAPPEPPHTGPRNPTLLARSTLRAAAADRASLRSDRIWVYSPLSRAQGTRHRHHPGRCLNLGLFPDPGRSLLLSARALPACRRRSRPAPQRRRLALHSLLISLKQARRACREYCSGAHALFAFALFKKILRGSGFADSG